MSSTVELKLPKDVIVTDAEIRMIVAARLFDIGELSSGQAADLAGITKREFLESVGRYGVSNCQYDEKELDADLARLKGKTPGSKNGEDSRPKSRDEIIAQRKRALDRLRGIAAVPGKTPPTDEEWREARTEYLAEKYK